MPSLGQLYNDKDAGLTTRKTYNVPLDKIYAEEGYNVRELNRAHVEEFRDAFIAGEYIPPLAVDRATCARLKAATRPDHRDADLAALVRSACRPGLAERVRAYRSRRHGTLKSPE